MRAQILRSRHTVSMQELLYDIEVKARKEPLPKEILFETAARTLEFYLAQLVDLKEHIESRPHRKGEEVSFEEIIDVAEVCYSLYAYAEGL